MYICPLCRQALHLTDRQYRCASNHSFDVAKEGYVNLLPVQQKNSKDPGDNKLMIQARRAFLHSGAYQPLSDAVNKLVQDTGASQILDLGCGEGYYSGRLLQQLGATARISGIDISKAAIKYAARHYPAINFAVASAYQVPYADNSIDAVVRIYAPSANSELQRLLRPQGVLISVSPGPQHLVEMKQAVYSEVQPHSNAVRAEAGFNHLKRQSLRYTLDIVEPQQLDNLLQMVPLAWKFSPDSRQQFVATTRQISIDFLLDVYQRQ